MTASPSRRSSPARGSLRPRNILRGFLRRLLYLIVRTRVAPDGAAPPGVDAHRPLCYVLQDRHLSSLLVLEREATRLGLPSPLAPIATGFPAVQRAVFSVILTPNPLSARTADPSTTL